jgi:hypothetical protein
MDYRLFGEVFVMIIIEQVEDHRQRAPAKVVKLPFYEPEWKKK